MILNVSGRCDIVAHFSEWFINRYNEGYVDVRNPFYRKQVSRIYFRDVDAIMFCTKNPIPILKYINQIDKPILFHVTLTPYKKDIEPNVVSKTQIIDAVIKLSNIIGSDNVYVRYDPIFLSEKYDLEYHKRAFDRLCKLLNGYVNRIIISFIDDYKNVRKNYRVLSYREFTKEDYEEIGKSFYKSASENDIRVQTCFEEENLCEYGFIKDDCFSFNMAYKLTGKTNFKRWKARKEARCNCVEMVDIGVYNTCRHFCKYCYANYDEVQVLKNIKDHDPASSLLIGHLENVDVIKVRQ